MRYGCFMLNSDTPVVLHCRPVEKVEAQSVPIQNRNLLERWHTRFVQAVRLRRHAATNVVTDTSSPRHYPDDAVADSGALTGTGGPAKSPRRRTAFFRLCANDDMYPSQSTFHNLRNLLLAQPKRSCDANTPSAIVFLLSISVLTPIHRNSGCQGSAEA